MESPENTKASAPVETGKSAAPPSTEQPTRKRRGRPFVARNTNGATPPLQETAVGVDPSDAPKDDSQPRKQRKKTVDADALSKQLKGIHSLMAKMLPLKGPDGKLLLELSDDEARELGSAVAGVAKEYDLALDGKTGAAIQLLAVSAMIYGPRVYVIQQYRLHMRRAAQPQEVPVDTSTVVSEQNINGSATAATN